MEEWKTDAKIISIRVYGPSGEYGAAEAYDLGQDLGEKWGACTEIRPIQKSGMHANIPYIQVWAGDHLHAEFCQHNIVATYFEKP